MRSSPEEGGREAGRLGGMEARRKLAKLPMSTRNVPVKPSGAQSNQTWRDVTWHNKKTPQNQKISPDQVSSQTK